MDWGQGALGDMGAHLIDFPVWALDLDLPTAVETMSTPFNDITFPLATMTHYDFPAKGTPAGGAHDVVRRRLPAADARRSSASTRRLVLSGGILYIGTQGQAALQRGHAVAPAAGEPAQLVRRAQGECSRACRTRHTR